MKNLNKRIWKYVDCMSFCVIFIQRIFHHEGSLKYEKHLFYTTFYELE